ncbi:MAG: chromate reductase [Candidatus Azotimanducaceae bacterium]
MISILGLYGSLRVGSYNLAMLRAMKLLAPNSIEFVTFDDISDIPFFNPDRSEDDIPVALPNTSPRAFLAQVALRTVLETMSAIIVEKASIKVPLLSKALDAEESVNNEQLALMLQDSLEHFEAAIRTLKID